VGKRERFYQQKNHSGDTALQVAGNAKNKELVQKLLFLPGADAEEKSAAHPKGVDFTGLGIHYGKLLALESALLFERNLALGERLDSQEEVIACHREAIGAVIGELGEARQSIAMLTDALERSERNQLMLMQVVSALAAGNPDVQRLLAGADGGRVAAPFLALRDLAGAGAGAGEGVEEAKGLD
jgi:hypothetical protein